MLPRLLCLLYFSLLAAADTGYLNRSAIASDSLRSGFQGTYTVANVFLDSMTPKYELIFSYNASNYSMNDVKSDIGNFFGGKDWKYYVSQVGVVALFPV